MYMTTYVGIHTLIPHTSERLHIYVLVEILGIEPLVSFLAKEVDRESALFKALLNHLQTEYKVLQSTFNLMYVIQLTALSLCFVTASCTCRQGHTVNEILTGTWNEMT